MGIIFLIGSGKGVDADQRGVAAWQEAAIIARHVYPNGVTPAADFNYTAGLPPPT